MLDVRRILVGIDFSEYSREAAKYAIFLARKLDASVTLAHISDMPAYVGSGYGPYHLTPLKSFISKQKDVEKANEEQLHRFVEGLVEDGDRLEYIAVSGSAPGEMIRLSNDLKSDLIVLGTHGRTGISQLLIGSVAEKVVRKAMCPVLTVKLTSQKFVSSS